jgi:ubiquinone/menaquinone biosynthesis C-methylase UbiE
MHINSPENRLNKFWGKVDKKHISLISEWIKGDSLLDVGSGFGTTSGELSKTKNIKCIGIDYDNYSLNIARKLYPTVTYLNENCEKLSFSDNQFDTIVLRDVLHHLKGEADFEKIKKELIRVSKPNARIIVLDPNINLILRISRKLVSHKDEECNFEDAFRILDEMHGVIIYKNFNTVFSLPLSGGYVGISFVPNINIIHKVLFILERFFEKIINLLKLGRYFCWRYLIVSEIIK